MTMMIMVQGRHETVFGVERDLVHPSPLAVHAGQFVIDFQGQHLQCTLHGVAFHPHRVFLKSQMGVVAHCSCQGKFAHGRGEWLRARTSDGTVGE